MPTLRLPLRQQKTKTSQSNWHWAEILIEANSNCWNHSSGAASKTNVCISGFALGPRHKRSISGNVTPWDDAALTGGKRESPSAGSLSLWTVAPWFVDSLWEFWHIWLSDRKSKDNLNKCTLRRRAADCQKTLSLWWKRLMIALWVATNEFPPALIFFLVAWQGASKAVSCLVSKLRTIQH